VRVYKQTTKPELSEPMLSNCVGTTIVCVSVWAMDGMTWEDWNSLNKSERRSQKHLNPLLG